MMVGFRGKMIPQFTPTSYFPSTYRSILMAPQPDCPTRNHSLGSQASYPLVKMRDIIPPLIPKNPCPSTLRCLKPDARHAHKKYHSRLTLLSDIDPLINIPKNYSGTYVYTQPSNVSTPNQPSYRIGL